MEKEGDMCCGWGRGGGVEVGVDVGSYDRLEDVVAAVVDAVVVGRRSEEVLRCGGSSRGGGSGKGWWHFARGCWGLGRVF